MKKGRSVIENVVPTVTVSAALATPAWGGSARASKAKKRATAPRIAIVTISSRLAGARLNRRASSPTLKFNVPDQARRESPGARVENQA